MSDAASERFGVRALRQAAGGTTFARGQAYHEDGLVEIASVSEDGVVALVQGSEIYSVELTGQGDAFSGTCTCPAYADWGFCKHLVATGLTANAVAANGGVPAEGTLDRVRRYLAGKDRDALVDMIVGLAAKDCDLLRSLDMAAVALGDDATVAARYRKAIEDATLIDDYVPYREMHDWAEQVDIVLDRIAELVGTGRAALAIDLATHAVDCLADAMGGLDDSAGHCGGLMERAAEIHCEACRAAPPDPVALAQELFRREVEDDGSGFYGAATAYAEALGESGLAEYRRLAEEAWAALPPVRRATHDETRWTRYLLKGILDGFADQDGDLERRIALRAADLGTPHEYLQLATFCRDHGRHAEALRWAEEGVWMFEDDRPDVELVMLAAELLTEADRADEAEALLWRAYEQEHAPDLYDRLRALGGEAARDRAIALLRASLPDCDDDHGWSYPADGLVLLLTDEGMPDEAWAVAEGHRVSPALKEALARSSEGTHPQQALTVYANRIDQLVAGGGNENYREAHRLLGRMAKLREADAQAAHVADLKQRFKPKRNFMKLLAE